MDHRQAAEDGIRKRKATTYDTDKRLRKVSKRLSQLRLGRNGEHLGVPTPAEGKSFISTVAKPLNKPPLENEQMRLDDTRNKVYIYNLDDELSDSDSEEGKIVFLPDIEKRLLDTRIPPSVLANKDGELAGRNLRNELVLYGVPTSLTVPVERDSVRKAIIEARARARTKQRSEHESASTAPSVLTNGHVVKPTLVGTSCTSNGASPVVPNGAVNDNPYGFNIAEPPVTDFSEHDPDAMDLT